MLRIIVGNALRSAVLVVNRMVPATVNSTQRALFASFNNNSKAITAFLPTSHGPNGPKLLSTSNLLSPTICCTTTPLLQQSSRSVTKFSLIKGKRKTVKAVIKRFKRLDWGMWIRTHSGRAKHLFKKSAARKRRLQQHIFTNSTQSWLLDKMVTNYWRRPKNYIDDPYAPYNQRNEFFATKSKTFKV